MVTYNPEYFQQLINEEYIRNNKQYQSVYGKNIASKSPHDRIQDLLFGFMDQHTVPFSKMMAHVLTEQAKECFPDKWMSESFSNKEQIQLCKHEVYDKTFGKFHHEENRIRDSSYFQFADCEREARNNILAFSKCIKDFETAVTKDNERLSQVMRDHYAKFM
jgi:hypothetical protein